MSNPEYLYDQYSSDFAVVQPIFKQLVQNYTLQSLNQLEQALKCVQPQFISVFQNYLIIPIVTIIENNCNEKMLIKSLEIATYVFNGSNINSWPLFSNTLHAVILKISAPKKISGSEELKLSVCECVSAVIQNASETVRRSMYAASFVPALAHIVYTFVNILNSERSKTLRKAILHTIGLICYSKEYIPLRNPKTEALASISLSNYLPGLSICLGNIISGDGKQGEHVIRMALSVLRDVIVITLNDSSPMDEDTNTSPNQSNPVLVGKSKKWFQETASKLLIILTRSTVLVTHDHWKVRQEYLAFARLILLNCTRNLENCVPVLLPAVFALSVDIHKCVSHHSQAFIETFSEKFQTTDSLTLCSIIEDELYSSASKLIRCKLNANDDQKLFTLRSVLGCLQILGTSIDKIILSVSHLEKLLMGLLSFLEFESDLPLVEEVSVDLDVVSPNHIMPRKIFRYFDKREILDTVCNICCCLGKSKYNRLVIDFLIEKIHTSEIYLLQTIFLIGCVVEGFPRDSDVNVDLIGDIIDELLCPTFFNIPLQNMDTRVATGNEQCPVQICNDNNIYQICLILESVEKCAKKLGKGFKEFLIKVLFKVMEKAGSSIFTVSQAGKICLYGIARYCDYNPKAELIKENADYLVNSIILNYHNFLYKPEMSAVLQVVLQESDGDMLPLFGDCIERLLKMLDSNQQKAIPIVSALKSVVVFVKKWFPSQNLGVSAGQTPTNKLNDLKSYFLEKNKKKEELYDDSSNHSEEEETLPEGDSNPEDKKKAPLHATLVAKILKKCSHFQSCSNLQLKVLVLEVMESSILALGDFENELHPLIHQLWDTFVKRFAEENIVMLQAFRVLLVICDECRDFVRSRCLKDIIPKLVSILRNKRSSSLYTNYIRSYQWSNDCRLQLLVLSEIGNLFVKLDVAEKDIAELAEVCLPYLQRSQAKLFREAAFKTLNDLAVVNPNALWFYFNCYYAESKVLNPPHESLNSIHFKQASNELESEFKLIC